MYYKCDRQRYIRWTQLKYASCPTARAQLQLWDKNFHVVRTKTSVGLRGYCRDWEKHVLSFSERSGGGGGLLSSS
jgi:hypothetical protein